MIQEKRTSSKNSGSQSEGGPSSQRSAQVNEVDNVQYDILHRLYKLDKKYINSFTILL